MTAPTPRPAQRFGPAASGEATVERRAEQIEAPERAGLTPGNSGDSAMTPGASRALPPAATSARGRKPLAAFVSIFRFCQVCREWRIPEHPHTNRRYRTAQGSKPDAQRGVSPRTRVPAARRPSHPDRVRTTAGEAVTRR